MIDNLMDVLSNVVLTCGVGFAVLAVMGFVFYFGDKFIIYIVKKVRERHSDLKEKEPK